MGAVVPRRLCDAAVSQDVRLRDAAWECSACCTHSVPCLMRSISHVMLLALTAQERLLKGLEVGVRIKDQLMTNQSVGTKRAVGEAADEMVGVKSCSRQKNATQQRCSRGEARGEDAGGEPSLRHRGLSTTTARPAGQQQGEPGVSCRRASGRAGSGRGGRRELPAAVAHGARLGHDDHGSVVGLGHRAHQLKLKLAQKQAPDRLDLQEGKVLALRQRGAGRGGGWGGK